MVDPEYELPITYEYVVCPYCGGLNFDDYRNGAPSKPVAAKPVPPIRYPTPVTSQPIQSTQDTSQFDPADLMQHSWKGKKIGDKQYELGSLLFGWDYADQFNGSTVEALKRGPVEVDQYVFRITDNLKLVQTKKMKRQ